MDGVNDQIQKLIAFVTGMIFFFAGYALMPLMFRLAGGMVATIGGFAGDKSRGVFDSQRKKRQGLRDQQKERLGRQVLQKRANWSDKLQSSASKEGTGWIGGKVKRGAARAIGGYNVESGMSARRASVGKEINDQIATGRDEEIRGLTVNRGAADRSWAHDEASGNLKVTKDANGNDVKTTQDGLRRVNGDGKVQYKSLGGAWVDDAHVRAGQKRWGKDHFAQQAALSYEMRKASTEDEVKGIEDRYIGTAREQWGQSLGQANGTWVGSAFENQGNKLHYKRMSWDGSSTQPNYNGAGQVTEMYENKGSYNAAQLNARSIDVLGEEYKRQGGIAATSKDAGEVRAAKETMTKITAISETFMNDMGGGGDPSTPEGQARGGTGGRRINTPGSAHVSEAAYRLAHTTGVLKEAPDKTAHTVTLNRMPDRADILADTNRQQ